MRGIALVGAGAFGQFCLEAFAEMSEVRIVGIVDVDYARAQATAEKYGTQAYRDLNALLDEPAVEIVALNTPPYLHAEQGLHILQAGRHLFCEKPLALTVEDGERLVNAAQENRALLTVNYVMRHNPFWAAAATLGKWLGQLRHMDLANHAAGLSLPAEHWFWDRTKSGGIWIEHGVHFFDAFAWVAGQSGKIIGARAYVRKNGVFDRVEALARYGDTAAHFYHAFDQSGQTEQTTVLLTFEHGYVTLHEWVPTSIEILTPIDFDSLRSSLPGLLEFKQQANRRNWICARAPEGKSAVYRQCIQAGLRDLVNALDDPQHLLKATGMNGLESLRLAVMAERAQSSTL